MDGFGDLETPFPLLVPPSDAPMRSVSALPRVQSDQKVCDFGCRARLCFIHVSLVAESRCSTGWVLVFGCGGIFIKGVTAFGHVCCDTPSYFTTAAPALLGTRVSFSHRLVFWQTGEVSEQRLDFNQYSSTPSAFCSQDLRAYRRIEVICRLWTHKFVKSGSVQAGDGFHGTGRG
jgi:hypothetical protein